VKDLSREVRGLLEYCGLPFEDQCLRFFENRRSIQTASAEQLRQPIFSEARRSMASFRAVARTAEGGIGRLGISQVNFKQFRPRFAHNAG
jgi:hypothetical protein